MVDLNDYQTFYDVGVLFRNNNLSKKARGWEIDVGTVTNKLIEDMERWCKKNLLDIIYLQAAGPDKNSVILYVLDDADAMAFKAYWT